MPSIVGFEIAEQQRIALASGLDGPGPCNHRIIRVRGPLDAERVRANLAAATVRHEVLRTTFVAQAGRKYPVQTVADAASAPEIPCETVELPPGAQAGDLDAVGLLARRFLAGCPDFDPRRGPLLQVAVGRLAPDDHVLVLRAHAAVLDGRSLELLARELLGEPAEDDPLPYGDYAAWQSDVLDDADPVPPGEPAATRLPLAPDPVAGGERVRVALGAGPVAAVNALAGGDGGAEDVWLALWCAVLARSTGQQDVVIAVADHGRTLTEVTRALGPFGRRLPIRVTVPAGGGIRELAAAVARARADAEDDRERLGAALRENGTLLGAAAAPAAEFPVAAGRELSTLSAGDSTGFLLQADLTGIPGAPAIDCDAAAAGSAEALAGRLTALAAAVAADPEGDLRALDVLPEAERNRLRTEIGRGPDIEVPEPRVHELFAAQAARTPDAPAVAGADGEIGYAALDAAANRIARALVSRGVGRGSVVALLAERTPDLIAGVLGTLKSGAAYLPLNPRHPASRIAFQLADSGAEALLTDAVNAESAAGFDVPALRLDDLPAGLPDSAPPAASAADDIAYLIYTSGSTGTPKAVRVPHAALGSYVAAVTARFGWDAEPLRFALVTTLSTDLGNTSVFPALATGSCLELVPVETAVDGALLAAYLRERPVDVLKIAPSHLRALLAAGAGVLPRKWLIVGGESLPWSLAEQVRALGDCALVNHYGPTETTIGSLTHLVGDQPAGGPGGPATVPIGRPLGGTTIAVVDTRGAPVPIGAPGELLIGGAGLAEGYHGRPELTAERFLPAGPWGAGSGRVYRTGDLVRVLADGELEFLGRIDGQVKIRGFRVEPGEVESVLAGHPAVREVAVLAQPDPRGDLRLVAYTAPEGGPDLPADLRAFVLERLPDYLVPAAIVPLAALPLAPNGKLAVAELPAPESVAAARPYVEPAAGTQQGLAAIWCEVLGTGRVGAEDDFFQLGGHSLLAMQVIARVRGMFGVQLPLHCLFTAPRIVDLAAEVDARATPASDADEVADLLSAIEDLSDEEAAALLEAESGQPGAGES